jgi:hypothetical protein
MNTIKTWQLWALWLLVILLAIAFVATASAEEVEPPKEPQPVQDFVQCTYKPSPSDALVTYCETLKGKGYISVRLCGVNYTIDIICK